jgi:riboflavin synthase
MFTGIIEAICTVKSVSGQVGSAGSLSVDLGQLAEDCKFGDSIAVNGVCLTVSRIDGSTAGFDLSAETLAKSNLGKLRPGAQVNIERAMKATGRFGGHFVQGHVDGTATIKAIKQHGHFADIVFATSEQLLNQMIVKGSVAVDGISLTVAAMSTDSFGVAVIPETLNKTTLGKARIGNCVNIETDIIIKAVAKQLDNILPKERPLTMERLKEMGF